VPAGNTGYGNVWVAAAATEDPKCVRCWQRRADVGSDSRHPKLCLRCVSNVEGPGEQRAFV
jgi:isoleucyl-tRNA synthetase